MTVLRHSARLQINIFTSSPHNAPGTFLNNRNREKKFLVQVVRPLRPLVPTPLRAWVMSADYFGFISAYFKRYLVIDYRGNIDRQSK